MTLLQGVLCFALVQPLRERHLPRRGLSDKLRTMDLQPAPNRLGSFRKSIKTEPSGRRDCPLHRLAGSPRSRYPVLYAGRYRAWWRNPSMAFDIRQIDLAKLNSMTKYPSI